VEEVVNVECYIPAMGGQEPSRRRDKDASVSVGTPVQLLGLSSRALNVLDANGIKAIEDLDRWSDAKLLKLHNCGRRSVAEIRAAADRWQGEDHVQRLARYLRRNLPGGDRERLVALLASKGADGETPSKAEPVPTVRLAMAYLDEQAAVMIDPRVQLRLDGHLRPGLRRIREALDAAEASLDQVLRPEGREA